MDFSAEDEPAPAASSDLVAADIPDWLKAMAPPGASAAQDAPAADQNLEAADLDWLSGLGGPIASAPASQTPAPSDSQPDWLKDLGGSATMDAAPSEAQPQAAVPDFTNDQPDWMKELGTSGAAADDSVDWLQQLNETPQSAAPAEQAAAPDDDMDWLTGLGLPEDSGPAAPVAAASAQQNVPEPAGDDMDWLTGLGLPQDAAPVASASPQIEPEPAAADDDWLAGLGIPNDSGSVPPPVAETLDTSTSVGDDMDWLKNLGGPQQDEPPSQTPPAGVPASFDQPTIPQKRVMGQDDPNFVPPPLSEVVSGPGTSEAEQDDAMKWLESLAANQGAKAEELLTHPDERTDAVPIWATQPTTDAPVAQTAPPAEQPTLIQKKPVAQDDPNFVPPPLSEVVSGPGTSEAEQDDAMKWLESLAANQGAKAEELLTHPDERTNAVPTWATQPTTTAPVPATPVAPVEQPTLIQKKPVAQDDPNFVPPPLSEVVSGPGTSEAEQDDAMKWLESLAANQGAKPEELLTHPDERTDAAPPWAMEQAAPPTEQPTTPQYAASEQDDAMKWLDSLAETQAPKTEDLMPTASDDVPDWAAETAPVDVTPVPAQPAPVAETDDTMDWLQNLGANEPVADQTPVEAPTEQLDFSAPATKMPWETQAPSDAQDILPAAESEREPEPAPDVSEWLKNLDVESNTQPPAPAPAPVTAAEDAMPDWLNSKQQSSGSEDDLPDWLKGQSEDEQPATPTPASAWVSDTDETSHLIFSPPIEKAPPPPPPPPAPAPVSAAAHVPTTPVQPPAPIRPAVRQTGMLGDKDGPALQNARHQMAHGGMDVAISGYVKLIKRAKFLEEVIYDLKEATYTHPVDVIVWQTLGDAHMRANQLQDALDAYTKAEELLR